MNILTLLGLAAACCTTIAFLPQLIKIVKSRRAEDVSLLTFAIFAFGVALWLVYGLLIWDIPVITANFFTLVFVVIILYYKLKFG